MHELGLAESICRAAMEHVGAMQKLTAVLVECGPLCGVVPDALTYCFGITAKHYGLEDATLILEVIPAQASCAACHAEFTVVSMWAPCPKCSHAPVTVSGGRELRVKQIEVEERNHV